MKDTTSIGDLSEFEVATALMRTRKRVLRPLSAGLRYDLAIDNGDGTVLRVQCKTGILRNGFITFRVCNADARRPQGVPYRGQIEAFGVYCPQNGRAYLIPIDAVGANTSTARLRVDATRNGQHRGIRLADSFQIG
jgi:hypothetical protein